VGDVLDYESLRSVLESGIDIVFHEAAIVSIRESAKNFYNDAMTNIMGTLNVLRACMEFGVKKLVFASSMAVYGDSPERVPIPEGEREKPIAPYGLSKQASERYLSLMAESNPIDVICLRYFNTYGENQSYTPYVGVITIFANRLMKGEAPLIFGDGNQTRDFVYVKDIVDANIKAMYADIHRGIFNVGTGTGTTVRQIAEILIDKINPAITPIYSDAVPGELIYSVADISRIKKELNFSPRYSIRDSIDKVLNQYKL
jgi:UDP-glucose 4-epimerase